MEALFCGKLLKYFGCGICFLSLWPELREISDREPGLCYTILIEYIFMCCGVCADGHISHMRRREYYRKDRKGK